MNRKPLTDGSGRWFDEAKAEKFNEDTWWNGHNKISCATGSQWGHEALYRTAGKQWVLNHWSQYEGSRERYDLITDEEAAKWLVVNHAEHPDATKDVAALEVK